MSQEPTKVSECQLPNVHCGYPSCVTEGHCIEDRKSVLDWTQNVSRSTPANAEVERWQSLYLGLRQKIEELIFPPGDPRRGGRTEAELLSELERRITAHTIVQK